jgi:hypothetical protein
MSSSPTMSPQEQAVMQKILGIALASGAVAPAPPVSPNLRASFRALFGDKTAAFSDHDVDAFLADLVTFARTSEDVRRSEQAARSEREAVDRFLATTDVGRHALELRRAREGKA